MKNNEVRYTPQIVLKRNDSRLNRHQNFQLLVWRANCDIQIILDHTACLEYVAKYATKAEKLSSDARDAFTLVIRSAKDDSNTKSLLRKLMIKAVGEGILVHKK